MPFINLAVLLTCYNRREKTLECLSALFQQDLLSDIQMSVYLVDDNSSDGTADVVCKSYPQVKLIHGSGNLFWNRGMHLAFAEAIKDKHCYYFWLNDDTLLFHNALSTLLTTHQEAVENGKGDSIIVGSIQDPVTKKRTYGGSVRSCWWHPLRFKEIEPNKVVQICHSMNGNAVLVPCSVVDKIGNLDFNFKHYLGDFDYALRAQQNGCSVWVASEYVGFCPSNDSYSDQTVSGLHINELLKKVRQPKGLPTLDLTIYSFKEWAVFTYRHGGALWFIYFLLPYRRFISLALVALLKSLKRKLSLQSSS